jgi:hypothetical protein
MSPEKIAFAIAVAVIACGVIGLVLQRMLHEKHSTGRARDIVSAIVGLLTPLSAVSLGLLIWTAYGVYAGQNKAIQTLAAKLLQLDMTLDDYGPDAKPVRLLLRDGLEKTIDQIWGSNISAKNFVAQNFVAALRDERARQAALDSLHPSTDEQKKALATANSTVDAIAQSRLEMSFALSAPVSYPLVFTVVSWVALVFLGHGFTSNGSPTSVIAIMVGARAIASAFYIILDLSDPYEGAFRVSAAPLEQAVAVMGKE